MNADERFRQREQISALADGQLNDHEVVATIAVTAGDADARACWQMYHLVGDVMRSGELGAYGRDRDFLSRLNTRLLREADVPRIFNDARKSPELIADRVQNRLGKGQSIENFPQAANESSFRWKLVAGFASLAAVVAVSWSAVGLFHNASDDVRLAHSRIAPAGERGAMIVAGAPADVPVAPVMIRDRELDALMAAHRQFGGNSALQNPSGFLRNATFQGVTR